MASAALYGSQYEIRGLLRVLMKATRELLTSTVRTGPGRHRPHALAGRLPVTRTRRSWQCELAEILGEAAPDDAVGVVARAYSSYAAENPALYGAMFTRATQLRFGPENAAVPLSTAYAELRAAVATIAGERDAGTLTEVLWAALNGLTTLGRNGRLRPGA